MNRPLISTLALSLTLGLVGCGTPSDKEATEAPPQASEVQGAGSTAAPTGGAEEGVQVAEARLVDPAGAARGTVRIDDVDGKLEVVVDADGLEPGFHGMHLHTVGKCEPASPDPKDPKKTGDFLSSGGHLGEGAHPEHPADLPPLLVMKDGTARTRVTTDRLDPDMLLDEDGSAVVVHAGPDNFANIPERYRKGGADEETKKAGDAGPRVACGAFVGG